MKIQINEYLLNVYDRVSQTVIKCNSVAQYNHKQYWQTVETDHDSIVKYYNRLVSEGISFRFGIKEDSNNLDSFLECWGFAVDFDGTSESQFNAFINNAAVLAFCQFAYYSPSHNPKEGIYRARFLFHYDSPFTDYKRAFAANKIALFFLFNEYDQVLKGVVSRDTFKSNTGIDISALDPARYHNGAQWQDGRISLPYPSGMPPTTIGKETIDYCLDTEYSFLLNSDSATVSESSEFDFELYEKDKTLPPDLSLTQEYHFYLYTKIVKPLFNGNWFDFVVDLLTVKIPPIKPDQPFILHTDKGITLSKQGDSLHTFRGSDPILVNKHYPNSDGFCFSINLVDGTTVWNSNIGARYGNLLDLVYHVKTAALVTRKIYFPGTIPHTAYADTLDQIFEYYPTDVDPTEFSNSFLYALKKEYHVNYDTRQIVTQQVTNVVSVTKPWIIERVNKKTGVVRLELACLGLVKDYLNSVGDFIRKPESEKITFVYYWDKESLVWCRREFDFFFDELDLFLKRNLKEYLESRNPEKVVTESDLIAITNQLSAVTRTQALKAQFKSDVYSLKIFSRSFDYYGFQDLDFCHSENAAVELNPDHCLLTRSQYSYEYPNDAHKEALRVFRLLLDEIFESHVIDSIIAFYSLTIKGLGYKSQTLLVFKGHAGTGKNLSIGILDELTSEQIFRSDNAGQFLEAVFTPPAVPKSLAVFLDEFNITSSKINDSLKARVAPDSRKGRAPISSVQYKGKDAENMPLNCSYIASTQSPIKYLHDAGTVRRLLLAPVREERMEGDDFENLDYFSQPQYGKGTYTREQRDENLKNLFFALFHLSVDDCIKTIIDYKKSDIRRELMAKERGESDDTSSFFIESLLQGTEEDFIILPAYRSFFREFHQSSKLADNTFTNRLKQECENQKWRDGVKVKQKKINKKVFQILTGVKINPEFYVSHRYQSFCDELIREL